MTKPPDRKRPPLSDRQGNRLRVVPGAVLRAYGWTPTRVEVPGSAGTNVSVLVYHDDGIAFAIASEGSLVELDGERAPKNPAAWITVFPPGGAGKIFPLPWTPTGICRPW